MSYFPFPARGSCRQGIGLLLSASQQAHAVIEAQARDGDLGSLVDPADRRSAGLRISGERAGQPQPRYSMSHLPNLGFRMRLSPMGAALAIRAS